MNIRVLTSPPRAESPPAPSGRKNKLPDLDRLHGSLHNIAADRRILTERHLRLGAVARGFVRGATAGPPADEAPCERDPMRWPFATIVSNQSEGGAGSRDECESLPVGCIREGKLERE
jgi:hypothetical protein